jgi:hypothetical protein
MSQYVLNFVPYAKCVCLLSHFGKILADIGVSPRWITTLYRWKCFMCSINVFTYNLKAYHSLHRIIVLDPTLIETSKFLSLPFLFKINFSCHFTWM